MSSESTVAHGPEHGLERMIFFSDAVFAIAITLLVIDLRVPHLPHGAPDRDYWIALVNLLPEFFGFFLSFFVIGFFWAGHHRLMALATHFTRRMYMPNLLLLSTVAAMPFFTAFASQNPGARVPTMLYCLWMLVVAGWNRRLQSVVLRPPIADPLVDPERVATIKQRGTAVILGSLSAVFASIVVPQVSQVLLATIPLWRWGLRKYAERKALRRPASAA